MVHDGGMLSLPNSLPPARQLVVLPSSSSALGKLALELTHNKISSTERIEGTIRYNQTFSVAYCWTLSQLNIPSNNNKETEMF